MTTRTVTITAAECPECERYAASIPAKPACGHSTYEDVLLFQVEYLKAEVEAYKALADRLRLLIPHSRRRWTLGQFERQVQRRKAQTRPALRARNIERERAAEALRRRVVNMHRREGLTPTKIAERLRGEGQTVSRQRVSRMLT